MDEQSTSRYRKKKTHPGVHVYVDRLAAHLQRLKTHPLLNLVRHRPRVILTSAWVAMMLVGGIAALSLVSLGPDRQAKLAEAERIAPPVAIAKGHDSNPAWSLGAIAIGCALGSSMISHRIKQSNTPRRLVKRSQAFPNS